MLKKKSGLCLLLICALALSALFPAALAEAPQGEAPAPADYSKIDLDLSALNELMAYSMLTNIIASPDRYQDKVMKAKGVIERKTEDGEITFYCTVYDDTNCCYIRLELLLREDSIAPKVDYDMIATGVFRTYKKDGAVYCQLIDAVLEAA